MWEGLSRLNIHKDGKVPKRRSNSERFGGEGGGGKRGCGLESLKCRRVESYIEFQAVKKRGKINRLPRYRGELGMPDVPSK